MKSRYSFLVNNLNEFLNPHSISTKCDIFEETLLKAANIETQPEKCKFGPESDTQLFFKIKGINDEEAESFLNFLKNTTGDENASKKFIPFVTSHNDETLDELEDLYHFTLDQDKANETLLSVFKDKFSTISNEKIVEYKEASKNDDRLVYFLRNLKQIKTRKLINGLQEFLIPQAISVTTCDIFEETLLKASGVETQPTKCQFNITSGHKGYINIQGITDSDAEKFLVFLKETMGDDSAEYTLVKDLKVDEPNAVEAHNFEMSVDVLIEKCIPKFKEEYNLINIDKLKEYREKSKKCDDVQYYIMKRNIPIFEKLVDDINEKLNPLLISCAPTDIFEETILKLAGVEAQPQQCQFAPAEDAVGKMHIRVNGINEEDTAKVLNFFKETLNDVNVYTKFIENCIELPTHEVMDAQVFIVDMDIVINQVLPLFNAKVDKINENSPEKLDHYRKLSEKDKGVRSFKMKLLFDEIMKQTIELQSISVSDYTRGQLNIIIDLLLNPTLQIHEENRMNPMSDKANDALKALVIATSLLNTVSEQDTKLSENETVKSLRKNLDDYCPVHKFGMFKTRPEVIEEEASNDLDETPGCVLM